MQQKEYSRATKVVFSAAQAVTFGAVALGSVVCATDSSAACPNWPGCYVGQITPKAELNPILEWVHRVVAVSCAPLLLATGLVGLRTRDRLVRWLPWVALVGAFIAGVMGMLTVRVGISKGLAAFDLASSLVGLLAITVATAVVLRNPARAQLDGAARAGWIAVAALLVFHVASILVAGKGSLTRCMSWPVWRLIEIDGSRAGQWVRLALAGAAVATLGAALVLGLREAATRGAALVVAVLVAVELVIGLTVIADGASVVVKAWYAAVAGAIFCGAGWLAALATIRRD